MSIKPDIFYPKSFSYFVNTSPKQELNSKKCKKFLTEVRDILNENNISYFLLFGTLLGAYRENDFIKHDRDIDIGILGESKEDFEKSVLDGCFAKKGILIFRDRNYSLVKDGIYMDIYPFVLDGDEYRSLLGWQTNYRLNPRHFPIQNIEFVGENFTTISNIEDYLVDKYGKDWETPIAGTEALS
jgi:lipopolysaccharide cholinephosphotransferase